MIGYLRGSLASLEPSLIVLDVQGVGYEVQIPLSTYYEVQKLEGDSAFGLHIHTHVREDTLALFGFWTDRERRLFKRLIAVSGIGPKLAQTVLSGMSPDDLIAALSAGDIKRLSSIPGIGKKTAERMILELRDKVRELASETVETQPAPTSDDDDLVQALVGLGYKPAAAQRAVAAAARKVPDAPFAEKLRTSLSHLSRT